MSREEIIEKIKHIDDDKLQLISKVLDNLDGVVIRKKKEILKPIDRSNIDKTTPKYQVLLEYVNGILQNIGKDVIDDITKFRDIDRFDIIKEENKVLLDNLAPKLFKHFDKTRCGYYRKTKGLALNCLRGMCRDMGFTIRKKQKNKQVNSIFKSHYYYSIV